MAVRCRPMGQQGIAGPFTPSTCEATLWRRCRRMTVHPFADTAGKRLGLRFRTREAAVKLGDPGPLVEIDLPVVG